MLRGGTFTGLFCSSCLGGSIRRSLRASCLGGGLNCETVGKFGLSFDLSSGFSCFVGVDQNGTLFSDIIGGVKISSSGTAGTMSSFKGLSLKTFCLYSS